VISGLDTTATVTVPELPLLPLALPLEPLLEQAASATSAATQPTAPNVRSLNGGELIADTSAVDFWRMPASCATG
jgi:hypothetical protein